MLNQEHAHFNRDVWRETDYPWRSRSPTANQARRDAIALLQEAASQKIILGNNILTQIERPGLCLDYIDHREGEKYMRPTLRLDPIGSRNDAANNKKPDVFPCLDVDRFIEKSERKGLKIQGPLFKLVIHDKSLLHAPPVQKPTLLDTLKSKLGIAR